VKIDSVDFYYLSMPDVLDVADGSQDLLLVRMQSGQFVGWGECEASPLVSIASWVAPMSHSVCKPLSASVLGQTLDSVADIKRIGDAVRANSLDLLQTDHTLSGIDITMWDLLGKRFDAPVCELLGIKKTYPKTPYASVLFGDTPAETLAKGQAARAAGYVAAKFGWGPYGQATVESDAEHVAAAREGIGPDGILLIDAGTIWKNDLAPALLRLAALQAARATWLEEPFLSGALGAYKSLANESGAVKLAGGEGSHNVHMAQHLIDHAGIGYIQIDAGRIGGIEPAREVALYARERGVAYVNHTFTSHIALAASLVPFVDSERDVLCEYPGEPKSLAVDITHNHIERDANGQVSLPAGPGLGILVNVEAANRYLIPAEIRVGGRTLYATPVLAE